MTPPQYFSIIRSEIEPLLPPSADSILDVGCGNGATSRWLRGHYPNAYIIGLDGNPSIVSELRHNVNDAHIVDLNEELPDVREPDLVLCLDVLEHLVDPEKVLRRLVSVMADNGTIIISLPNVAHVRVSVPLLLLGRFDYRDAGILDRTHLRFFTKESAWRLAERAGLDIVGVVRNGLDDPGARRSNRLLNIMTGGLLSDRFTEQYVFAARPSRGAFDPVTVPLVATR
jgi:2-polyprenyl-3-methyl-5-hydroxy-6-metoxy-1,4-benzoquinol methylase